MSNSKGKVSAKISVKKGAIKPKMGEGTGGFITTTVIAKVNKDKKNG